MSGLKPEMLFSVRTGALLLVAVSSFVAAVASSTVGKPVVTCAYKWAESPDEVHIFVRWAHKLSAPAVNNVDKSQVFVDIQPSSIGVRGEHKDKTLQVSIPLKGNLEVARSTWSLGTFGVTFVLRKAELQSIWGSLSPKYAPFVKTMSQWWEVKDKYDAEITDLTKNGASVKWLNEHPLRCEACRLTVENTLFAAPALAQWRNLKPPPTTEDDPRWPAYNRTLTSALQSACVHGTFAAPQRHLGAGDAVRIKGASTGGFRKSNSGSEAASSLQPEMRTACTALTKVAASQAKLIGQAYRTHAETMPNEETGRGSPNSFLEVTSTAAGRALLRDAVDQVCVYRTVRDDGHDSQGSGYCPKRYEANHAVKNRGRCGSCRAVVADLETKILRFALPDSSPAATAAAASSLASEEVEHACLELQWRHSEGGALGEACEVLVEEHDEALVALLTEVAVRAAASLNDASKRSDGLPSSSEESLEALCGPCASRAKNSKQGKGKKSTNSKKDKKAASKKNTKTTKQPNAEL